MGVAPSWGSLPCTHLLSPETLKQKVVCHIWSVRCVCVSGLTVEPCGKIEDIICRGETKLERVVQ